MEIIYIFIVASQKKTGQRMESLYCCTKSDHNITNWQCIDERIVTVNINILKARFTIIGVYGPNGDEPVANKDSFYETLQTVVTDFGNNRQLVITGDFNARTERSSSSHIIGGLGEECNDNGARLIHANKIA